MDLEETLVDSKESKMCLEDYNKLLLKSTKIEEVNTPYGYVEVHVQGVTNQSSAPTIITFHDLGLNSNLNFEGFFASNYMSTIVKKYSIVHINAPGQILNSKTISEEKYPTMSELSEIVEHVCYNFGIVNFVGLGAGLGANVLVRVAQQRPKFMTGLILLNCSASSESWIEWMYCKKHIKALKQNTKFPENVVRYLLWYHLGDFEY